MVHSIGQSPTPPPPSLMFSIPKLNIDSHNICHSTNAHSWIMSSPLIHTQSLEIDYSVTIRAIVMNLPDNKNESPKNVLTKF